MEGDDIRKMNSHDNDAIKINNDKSSDEIANETEPQKDSNKSLRITINHNAIPFIPNEQQDYELQCLNVTAYHQNTYEEEVLKQVDDALNSDATGHREEQFKDNQILTFFKKNLDSNFDDRLNEPSQVKCDHSNDSHDLNTNNLKHLIKIEDENDDNDCHDNDDDDFIDTNESESDNKRRVKSRYKNELNVYDDDNGDEITKSDDDDYIPSDDEELSDHYDDDVEVSDFEDEELYSDRKRKRLNSEKSHKKIKTKKNEKSIHNDDDHDEVIEECDRKKKKFRIIDDGNEKRYLKRIKKYQRECLIEKQKNIGDNGIEIKNLNNFIKFDSGFQIQEKIWEKLYPYQQAGVKWLWELHRHGCGGIIGDEMGLGKTIQMIAFLSALKCSKFHDFRDIYNSLGPVILICPATIMHQWVSEFHQWAPHFRVAILHHTGSYSGNKANLIRIINKTNGVLISSYSSVSIYQNDFLNYDWHYVILDEGHKIRNPDAQVTIACKMFRTPHRLILSGSPIQNNLKELWSLFDFIYPGKLGTLPVFMEHFAVPITHGGYVNASEVQIQVAYKCATVLRDTIKPYLLRRLKDDVKSCLELPSKNEQVLFCKLTEEQRQLYKNYLDSNVVKDIFKGSTQLFVGLINLRKICNHPDIFAGGPRDADSEKYGYYKKSGKMMVVEALLRIWHKQGHKVLLFTQSVKMLKIIKDHLIDRQYTHLLMDGATAVESRQTMVKQFNEDRNIFVFLLTTRVGGVGINLTGANRAIIYDPDWNPSTDIQARERCWRIGQSKQVTIYRLLCSGTIEEKIYHRQIFKQYLTNRVLKDPKQKRFFKTNDLYELFTLGSDSPDTETSAIFSETGSNVKVKLKKNDSTKDKTQSKSQLPPQKIIELRERAKVLSKMIADKFSKNNDNDDVSNVKTGETSSTVSTICAKDSKSQLNSQICNEKSGEIKNRKTKQKSKGIKFEGKRIKYLLKEDSFKEFINEKKSSDLDDYVLKKLFKKSKVQSALQHDKIETPSNPDYVIIEKEAETVAKDAIEALKKSRQLCLGASSGVPTWTGINGNPTPQVTKNKFGQRKNAAASETISSSALLEQIKKRNKLAPEDGLSLEDLNDGTVYTELSTEHDVLLADIRNFISFQSHSRNGEASTQEILDKFKLRIAPHQSAVFKAMLWQICDFHRNSDKVGVWRLKPEFR